MSDLSSPPVTGEVAPGFEAVREVFESNFTDLGEVGAGVCIYHRGEKVVDLVGGWASTRQKLPYDASTLQLVFSTTKGATAICAHILAERGQLDFDAPVVEYWPEFGAAGKEKVTVRHLLSHRSGLPTIDATLTIEEMCEWYPVTAALESQEPFWEPGTAHGYHALTYGWLVGEVVRRISGKSLGTFFADEVAGPLGLEFWIGLPAEHESRVSNLRMGPLPEFTEMDAEMAEMAAAMLSPDSLAVRALTLNGAFGQFMGVQGPFNAPEVHAAEVPAANGITNASSLARMYAATIGEVDGVRLLDPETVKIATEVNSEGKDKVLFTPSRFGLGFMIHYEEFSPLLGESSFGHTGAGGSVGFADIEAGIGFGYVMNQMRMGLGTDPRPDRLIDALRTCLA